MNDRINNINGHVLLKKPFLIYIMTAMVVLLFPLKTTLVQNKDFLYKSIKAVILFGFLPVLYIRFFIIKSKAIFLEEKLIFIYFAIAVISNIIINNQMVIHSVGNPVETLLLFLGLSSYFFILNDENNSIKLHIFKIFSIFPLLHILVELYNRKTGQLFSTPFKGLTWNQNFFGFISLTGFISAICAAILLSKKNKKGTKIIITISFINFLGVFLSGSRGSILGATIYFLFIFIWIIKNQMIRKRVIYYVFLLSIIFILIIYNFDIYKLSFLKFNKKNYIDLRFIFWINYFKDFISNISLKVLLFGKGFTGIINTSHPHHSMHNILISILGRYGILNLLIMLYIFFKQIIKLHTSGFHYLSFAVISILVYSFFDSQILIDNLNLPVFYFFTILLMPRNEDKNELTF
jgi:hypothetical protein